MLRPMKAFPKVVRLTFININSEKTDNIKSEALKDMYTAEATMATTKTRNKIRYAIINSYRKLLPTKNKPIMISTIHTTRPRPAEIHNGERTHHQDQVIMPHNLRVMKTTVNNPRKLIPPLFCS